MALTILGLSGALSHDPSAALYIDGKLIAAVEEERFVRDKHAKNRMPYESAKFCLEQAGIKPSDVDVVAIPFAPISIFEKARWHYAKRYWYAPDRALDAILMGNRRYYSERELIFGVKSFKKVVGQADSAVRMLDALHKMGFTHLMVRYDLFNSWSSKQFNDNEKWILKRFFDGHLIRLSSDNGYGLFELRSN